MTDVRGQAFWAGRPFYVVANYPVADWRQASDTNERLRQQRETDKRTKFYEQHRLDHTHTHEYPFLTTARHLTFWAQYSSWSYCNTCKMLIKNNLMPSFRNDLIPKAKASCVCASGRYIIPKFHQIPMALKDLTPADIITLRPFVLHTGDFRRHQHGYRQKNGFCRVSWSVLSVQEKIDGLVDASARFRCAMAYRYLTTNDASRYNHFINE